MNVRKFTPLIIGVLAMFVVLNLIVTSFLFYTVVSVDNRVDDFEEDIRVVTDYLLQDGELDYTGSSGEKVERQSGSIVAYDGSVQEGVVVDYRYQPLPGDVIYLDTSNVRVESGFQDSVRDAQSVVESSKYEPANKGLALSLYTPDEWEFVSGESAGVAIAAHIASTDPGYELNESVVLTGRIGSEGNVVSVNHVEEKADAAEKQGKELLVAPYGTGVVRTNEIEVVQVESVEEALGYALDETN